MNIKQTLVSIAVAGAMALGIGGCAKRHLVINNFDKDYSCEIKFSEDFESDKITLYEWGERVAIRNHEVHKHQDQLEHKISYDFFEGEKKVGEIRFRPMMTMELEGSVKTFYRMLNRYTKMQKCERLLQEQE
ncbi:hypothetical protein GOV03_01335 [Candidatus Woesearchaeota archaeon]|nr:hypothetical protein [Candidatus Woesearchaeota archaeon]